MDDNEKKIIDYAEAHPEQSRLEISEALGLTYREVAKYVRMRKLIVNLPAPPLPEPRPDAERESTYTDSNQKYCRAKNRSKYMVWYRDEDGVVKGVPANNVYDEDSAIGLACKYGARIEWVFRVEKMKW